MLSTIVLSLLAIWLSILITQSIVASIIGFKFWKALVKIDKE